MKTYYFKIDFGTTEDDVRRLYNEFIKCEYDGIGFTAPEKEIVLKVECDGLQNPFDALCKTINYGLFGMRNYTGHPVTITDVTAEIERKIEIENAENESFAQWFDELMQN